MYMSELEERKRAYLSALQPCTSFRLDDLQKAAGYLPRSSNNPTLERFLVTIGCVCDTIRRRPGLQVIWKSPSYIPSYKQYLQMARAQRSPAAKARYAAHPRRRDDHGRLSKSDETREREAAEAAELEAARVAAELVKPPEQGTEE